MTLAEARKYVEEERGMEEKLSASWFGNIRAPGVLAELLEFADVELSYWDRGRSGAVRRDLTEKERKLILRALRRVSRS